MIHARALCFSVLAAAAAVADPSQSQPGTEAGGHWMAYNGGMMTAHMKKDDTTVEPVHLVVDLASLVVPNKVYALAEHERSSWAICGHWDSIAVDGSLHASLTWYVATDDDYFYYEEARKLAALARRGAPLQVSVGTTGGEWELIPPGHTFTANGGEFTAPADGIPTYLQRGATLDEMSVVMFGADSNTGRIAASRFAAQGAYPMTHTNDATPNPVDDDNQAAATTATEDQAQAATDEQANDQAQANDDAANTEQAAASETKTDQQAEASEDAPSLEERLEKVEAQLAQATAANTELQGRLDAIASAPPTTTAAAPAAGKGATAAAPTTRLQAQAAVAKETGLKGLALAKACAKRFPDLYK